MLERTNTHRGLVDESMDGPESDFVEPTQRWMEYSNNTVPVFS